MTAVMRELPAILARTRQWGLLLPATDARGHELVKANGQPVYPTLTCPVGHAIAWDWNVGGDCFPRCTRRTSRLDDPSRDYSCGLSIWICPIPRRERTGAPRFIVAEIDWREIQYVSQQHMDADEIVRFLGLTWAPRAE